MRKSTETNSLTSRLRYDTLAAGQQLEEVWNEALGKWFKRVAHCFRDVFKGCTTFAGHF